MDTALKLKCKLDEGKQINVEEAKNYLDQSEVFKRLLDEVSPDVMSLLWRLTQLSEIPYAGTYPRVQEWLKQLIELTFTKQGFSITAKEDMILPCYNAMISSIIMRLQGEFSQELNVGIDWILNYQLFERDKLSGWSGKGAKKYGGCLKRTPCYIGLVKSTIALSDFKRLKFNTNNELIDKKLAEGLEYILQQKVFLRQSKPEPISKYILKLNYPFTWKSNVIELLRLINENDRLDDSRCNDAKNYLIEKRRKDGTWRPQTANILKHKAWVSFEKPRESGEWITHEIKKLVDS